MRKKFLITGACLLLASVGFSMNVCAAEATEYAYSIGHDFGMDIPFIDDHSGDCTISVSHASTVYGMLGYSSHYNFYPDYTYLRGRNPAGVHRLGSAIVYTDGHASHNSIIFGDTVDDSEYMCGIYYGTNFTSSTTGYTYAGLQSLNLTGVKLFTFVGCNTASGDSNLCTVANDGGATCVVGFTGEINGLSTEGQNWKQAYNNQLGNGATVADAITYATAVHPNCNLGDLVKTHGDASINITLGNTLANNQLRQLNMNIKNVVIPKDVSNSYFDFSSVENGVYLGLNEVKNEYEDIIQILEQLDSEFDTSKYKVLANGFYGDSGIIKVRYFINDIETSSVLVFSVVDGEIVSYTDNYAEHLSGELSEQVVLNFKDEYEQNNVIATYAVENKIKAGYELTSQTEKYYYDFSDDTLYYVTNIVYAVSGVDAYGVHEIKTAVN